MISNEASTIFDIILKKNKKNLEINISNMNGSPEVITILLAVLLACVIGNGVLAIGYLASMIVVGATCAQISFHHPHIYFNIGNV